MRFLINFFTKNRLFLFFILLQLSAIVLIFSKNAMQKSWIADQTTVFNAWVSGNIDEGTSYLKLKEINEQLTQQNKQLMTELYGKETTIPKFVRVHDTIDGGQVYTFVDGEIAANSINRKNNYFTINRGKRDGVESNMGVITPKGIAGIVINTTEHYSLAKSVLSVDDILINASLKKTGHFGTLSWEGEDTRLMHLSDIPKYVPLKIGDTVETDGKSAIFPKGIMIGKIAGFKIDQKTGAWDIAVELNEKMETLNKVYIIKNLKKTEVRKISDTLQATIDRENDK